MHDAHQTYEGQIAYTVVKLILSPPADKISSPAAGFKLTALRQRFTVRIHITMQYINS